MQNFTVSRFFLKQSGFESAFRVLPMLKTGMMSFLFLVGLLASSLVASAQDNDGCYGPYSAIPESVWGIAQKFESNPLIWGGSTPTAADLDGDGISELLVTALDKSGFYVYKGNGANATSGTKDYVIGVAQNRTMQVAVADIINNGTLPNGKPKPEVVAINRNGFVYIFGNEGGSETNFLYKSTTASQYTTFDSNNLRGVTPYIVDIDEDGTPEIVLGSDIFGIVNGQLVKRVAGITLPFVNLGGSPLDVVVVDIIPSNPGKELIFWFAGICH
jgi:hypothetical protein